MEEVNYFDFQWGMVNRKDVRLLDGPTTETVMNISKRGKHFIEDDSNTKYGLLDDGWLAEG